MMPRRLCAAALIAGEALLRAFAQGGAPPEDIRDIRGPKFILPWWFIPGVVAAVIGLALIAWLGWRWIKGRRRPRPLMPFEVALERLAAIRPLMRPQTVREFSIAVSDIVRSYIELRFDVTATHRTTEEFLHDLLGSPKASLVRHRAVLSEFLHQCDLVKFAGVSLTEKNIESLHDSARAFVLETAKPEPVDSVPATSQKTHDSLPST